MLKDQKDLLYELNAAGVEFVVIGGHAVNAYGVPRMTKDLDVLIRADRQNSEAVYRALASFGAPLAGTSPEDFRDRVSIFQIGVEPSRVDIFQTIAGVDFDQVWENRLESSIDDSLPIAFISREDLILNKLASGRPQDLADVDHLRRAAPDKSVK
jgi:predicted nucleotidyltransferase